MKPDALPSLHSRSAFTVKELMAVRPSELDGGGGGTIVDISFVSPYLPDIYLMTDRGNLFLASLEAERKTLCDVVSYPVYSLGLILMTDSESSAILTMKAFSGEYMVILHRSLDLFCRTRPFESLIRG